jgi:hypothetical protein
VRLESSVPIMGTASTPSNSLMTGVGQFQQVLLLAADQFLARLLVGRHRPLGHAVHHGGEGPRHCIWRSPWPGEVTLDRGEQRALDGEHEPLVSAADWPCAARERDSDSRICRSGAQGGVANASGSPPACSALRRLCRISSASVRIARLLHPSGASTRRLLPAAIRSGPVPGAGQELQHRFSFLFHRGRTSRGKRPLWECG